MEYLRIKFHEQLSAQINDDGNVEINGYPEAFSPHGILREMDEMGYEEVFNDWLNERRNNLMRVAYNLLSKYDNRDRFDSLRKTFCSGAVIPFVGAGMSIPSGYPGWTEYLKNICAESHIEMEALTIMLSEGKYEEAAQAIYDDMGGPSFNEHLNNKFGNAKEPQGSVHYLPLLFKRGVVTTNFDPILESVYDNANKKFDEIMLGTSAEEFPRLAATGKNILLKLHGHGDRLKDRVLTLDEYNAAYNEHKVLRNLVSHAFFNRTMLFLGCSLTTDRTIQLMAQYVDEFGHEKLPRHYAFVRIREGEDRLERRRQLVKANIFPIWYEDYEHDEAIEALLLSLADGVVEI